MKIGNVETKNNVFLAPMAGITDLPFRLICKEYGAGLVYTEMVSAKGLYYNDDKTKLLTQIDESERPAALQIFGSDADIMADVAKKIQKNADVIDINMGCPAPKVVKNDDGSKLMLNPKLIDEITKKVVDAVDVPVTIKIRKGWDEEHINAVEIAQIAEKNGISAITIHGRTREQFYTGKADWDIIKKVKENVSIPVIGNGDVIDFESAEKMFEYTKCDGIMIGRAALGNPWIFKQVLQKTKEKPSTDEIYNVIEKHYEMLSKIKGEYVVATCSGTVTKIFKNTSDCGYCICISTDCIDPITNKNISIIYMHLLNVPQYENGDNILKGDHISVGTVIGKVGNSNGNTDSGMGYHLHFEANSQNAAVGDPGRSDFTYTLNPMYFFVDKNVTFSSTNSYKKYGGYWYDLNGGYQNEEIFKSYFNF